MIKSNPGIILIIPCSSYRTNAFIEAVKRLELEVLILTNDTQVFEGISKNSIISLNFNHWTERITEIRLWSSKNNLTSVIGVDEESVMIAAEISKELGIVHNSIESVKKTRNKFLLRTCLKNNNLPSPWFNRFAIKEDPKKLIKKINYPCVLKPTFLSASQGVIRVDNKSDFIEGFKMLKELLARHEISRRNKEQSNWILIEEYIPGKEISIEGLVLNGKLKPLTLFDKPEPLEGPTFPETFFITPSKLENKTQVILFELAQQVIEALGIKHGPVHIEARINVEGIFILECAVRSIGGLCSKILQFSGGISLEELIIRSSLGRNVEKVQKNSKAKGIMIMPVIHGGVLKEIKGREKALSVKGITGLETTVTKGERLEPLPKEAKYPGFIFAEGRNQDAVENSLRKAWSVIEILFEDC